MVCPESRLVRCKLSSFSRALHGTVTSPGARHYAINVSRGYSDGDTGAYGGQVGISSKYASLCALSLPETFSCATEINHFVVNHEIDFHETKCYYS